MEKEVENNPSKSRNDYGHELMSWRIPEYEEHNRDAKWYIMAGAIAFILLIFAFWTNNFLFAVIVVVSLFIIVLHHENNPVGVSIKLTTDGIIVGKKFTDYKDLKNFSIVYQPRRSVKRLYFEPKNLLKYRISIPILSQDPLKIRENLLQYLIEDIDREDEPLSENLSRRLRL